MSARSPFELALSAAHARTPERRAWALVEVATALRREERLDEALALLDLVAEERASPHAELAAYTCAVAIHCDRGDYDTARVVGEDAASRATDAHHLAALGRMYAELSRETQDDALRAAADRCSTLAGLWEQLAAHGG